MRLGPAIARARSLPESTSVLPCEKYVKVPWIALVATAVADSPEPR